MATRRMVREAFYTELESSISGLSSISASDISQEFPNDAENLPAIAHVDNYREVPMNTNTGVVDTQEGTNGTTAWIYSEVMEGQFSVIVVSDDESEKEDIYEAVRSHFGEFKYPVRDASEMHSDIERVEVTDANSEDSEERDPPARGDRLSINLLFERYYTRDTTPVEEVTLNMDTDGDGVDEITRTTTTS